MKIQKYVLDGEGVSYSTDLDVDYDINETIGMILIKENKVGNNVYKSEKYLDIIVYTAHSFVPDSYDDRYTDIIIFEEKK